LQIKHKVSETQTLVLDNTEWLLSYWVVKLMRFYVIWLLKNIQITNDRLTQLLQDQIKKPPPKRSLPS